MEKMCIIPKEHMYVYNRSDAARTRLLVKAVPDELTVFTGEVQLSQILTLHTFNQLQRNLKTQHNIIIMHCLHIQEHWEEIQERVFSTLLYFGCVCPDMVNT